MDISNNYILIQGWMISKLNLSGNNLLLYALIYGFSQDEQSKFTGSLKYICKWLNCSKPTAIKSLNFLIENEFIKKESKNVNGVVFNEYSISKNSHEDFLPGVKNLYQGSKESLPGGSKESLPNNTNIYNTKNNIGGIYNNINSTKEKEKHEKNKERDISPPPIMQDAYSYRNVESDFSLNNQNANNNFEHIDWRAFCEMFNKETGKSVNAILPRTKQNIEQLMKLGYTKQHLVKAIHKAKENEYIKKNPKLLTPTHIFEPENFERYVT